MKITIIFKKDSIFPEKNIVYNYTSNTKVKELLSFLLSLIESTDFLNESYLNAELLGHFSFTNNIYGEQKAQLDYPLSVFLKNFKYNINSVNMIYYDAYGIGAYTELEELARIQINNNEKKHNNAHVHITRPQKRFPSFRIDLKSMTEMKTDNPKWDKEFSLKERNEIKSFLEYNKEKLIDYYNRATKGEYITEDYILTYKNRKYKFYKSRTY